VSPRLRAGRWLAGLLILGAAATVPGVANSSFGECPSGQICLWGNNEFKWLIAHRGAGFTSVYNLSGEANNEMDSWANRSGEHDVCGYGALYGGGDKQGWDSLHNDNNVSPWNSDEVSSWQGRTHC
jgi:hypothetical protein